MHTDISEKKKAVESLKESLKEKEVLLKEIHHRVKNNLQIVSSLLNIQSSVIADKNVVKYLMNLQSRVMSMSLIHENIYQSENLSDVNIREYISMLKNNLLQSYLEEGKDIKISTEIDEISIDISRAIPLGLIVAELITNSLKHAFPTAKEGIVMVELKKIEKSIILMVSDNGNGISKDLNIENFGTLGLKLIRMLVEQLNAHMEIKLENGVKTKIVFEI